MLHHLIILPLLTLIPSTLSTKCTHLGQRKAWHTLHHSEKRTYLDAELCLMTLPARLGLPGARTRYDELQSVHQQQAYATHYVGAFLPFHRLLMYTHETALREECGYVGYQPYWQEPLDAGHFTHATTSIFSPHIGFGGDGDFAHGLAYDPTTNASSECISDGPFRHYVNALGPGYEITDHCISRAFNDSLSALGTQEGVDACLALDSWEEFWPCVENAPHGGGHAGVNGEMINGVSSPGDPLFYLHHTWLDKIWWEWQHLNSTANSSTRFTYIAGNNVMGAVPSFVTFPTRPASIPQPTGADGDPGLVTTVGHVLNMYGNGPNRTIGEVLDPSKGFLCYEYIEA